MTSKKKRPKRNWRVGENKQNAAKRRSINQKNVSTVAEYIGQSFHFHGFDVHTMVVVNRNGLLTYPNTTNQSNSQKTELKLNGWFEI